MAGPDRAAIGNSVPVIARLVQADEDSVRQVIHRFNEMGMASLDPRWAGGRPRLISLDDEAFIVTTANTRPEALGQPFTRWSVRKLADYLAHNHGLRRVRVGRERLRQLLRKHELTFQRTKTWKESNDPARDAKLARIEQVMTDVPDRVFAFDEFGPLTIRPHGGASWAPPGHPDRLPANYHKLHGVRQFHGCYSLTVFSKYAAAHDRASMTSGGYLVGYAMQGVAAPALGWVVTGHGLMDGLVTGAVAFSAFFVLVLVVGLGTRRATHGAIPAGTVLAGGGSPSGEAHAGAAPTRVES